MAEYPNYIVEFYFDDEHKATVSTEASRTENALIIAFNELLTKTNILANNYIIYDIDNRETYKGKKKKKMKNGETWPDMKGCIK